MAWSWSHSNEAYAAAYANLQELPLETLQVIQAEWDARDPSESSAWPDDFSQWRYARALAAVKRQNLTTDILADHIWERASDAAICDNGGFSAWMCPYGCGPHCVPFDRETADTLSRGQ